ncbi:MAG: acetyl-CoA acetyltransferase [Novosphingobium sp.]
MTSLAPELTPVIIGVGELSDHIGPDHAGFEPRELLVRAARAADEDAGGGWLGRLTSVDIVNVLSWPYKDLAGEFVAALDVQPARAVHSPAGGETPLRLIHDIANRIAAGQPEVALVCGAEAFRSVGMAMKSGVALDWTPPDPDYKRPVIEDVVGMDMFHYGFDSAASVYSLYENAMRAARGMSHDAVQAETGELWAAMSRVAATVDQAWIRTIKQAEEIVAVTADNRPIAFPYNKLMIANDAVNQASAVIVTTLAMAQAAGIPAGRIAYVWGGAGAKDKADFRDRDRYDHSVSIEAVLDETMAKSGLGAGNIDAVEFYSCFPCVPKLASAALGSDPALVPTVAGGLTYFGGPGNNYMTHAVVNMVRTLRSGAHHGLLLGNGDLVTKHHAMILADHAPPAGTFPVHYDVQAEADRRRGDAPRVLAAHDGPATLETYTVRYLRSGQPEYGIVVCKTPAGERFVARVPASDTVTIAALTGGDSPAWQEPIGRRGTARRNGENGFTEWTLAA